MRKKRKVSKLFVNIFYILSLLTSVFAIYNLYQIRYIKSFQNYIYLAMIIILIILFIFSFIKINHTSKRSKKKNGILIFFLVLWFLITGILGGVIAYYFGLMGSLNKSTVNYTSDLIVLSSSDITDINMLNEAKIGILKDKKSYEGYIIPQMIIGENDLDETNEFVEFESYGDELSALYKKDVDAIFIGGNYESNYSSIYENISNDTKIIATKTQAVTKKVKQEKVKIKHSNNVDKPFSLVLLGVDTTKEGLDKNTPANGDTVIVITFNPKTYNTTMMSVPRDSYVPISCLNNRTQKITHAAAYGDECMLNTLENFLEIDIDYYAKINFKGLVHLVDALGGIDVDVPKMLCTDDSDRRGQVCIYEGHQHLNGEEALVYARNRKQLAEGDFGRQAHQQIIIKAMMEKLKEMKSVSKFTEILKTISNNLDTNLTQQQMINFYNLAMDMTKTSNDGSIVNFTSLYLDGSGEMIYDSGFGMNLYEYVVEEESLEAIKKELSINLEKEKVEHTKNFNFSINTPYEKKIIGKTVPIFRLPDFTGDTRTISYNWCKNHLLECRFIGSGGKVIKQDISQYTLSSEIDEVVLTLER